MFCFLLMYLFRSWLASGENWKKYAATIKAIDTKEDLNKISKKVLSNIGMILLIRIKQMQVIIMGIVFLEKGVRLNLMAIKQNLIELNKIMEIAEAIAAPVIL